MTRLADPRWLAGKAGLSAGLAVAVAQVLDVPDGVSAAFVAAVCTAPTVWSGLKRARDQVFASVLGALGAAGLAWFDAPLPVGVGLAVSLAIAATWGANLAHAYPVACFTAIYMLLLPKGAPEATLKVRLLAVAIGALTAVGVNAVLSWTAVRRVFRKRLERADGLVIDALAKLPVQPGLLRIASRDLDGLSGELAEALSEARLLRRDRRVRDLTDLSLRLEALRLVAHLAGDVAMQRPLLQRHDVERWLERTAAAMTNGSSLPPTPVPELHRMATAVATWQAQCTTTVGEIA